MTKMPTYLARHWEREAPEAPQKGTVEERAERLIEMHKEGLFKDAPAHLLQTLALDLLYVTIPADSQPEAVERLIVLALGLPPDHEPDGGWERDLLSRSGDPNIEAQSAAWLLDLDCLEKGEAPMGPRPMARALKDQGHKVTPHTIRQWRKSPAWKEKLERAMRRAAS